MAYDFFIRLATIADDFYAGKTTEAERLERAAVLWMEIRAAGPKIARAVKGYMAPQ